ncbi:NIPSNAP family protein [Agrobacterium arsenijevicii]|uniref:NIPSNAP family containing protein n=1 Tax=Agrobacterium arsenijevicii TaxID=1585697 RepID=A0ABR5DC00_9HYPH|nr:NIPSNAP family containing protein [Agrobacterium arsenijevicii]
MLFELRTYTAVPGRLPDLLKRFETITLGIWERFGIRQVGFWTVQIGESNVRLYYMLQWESLAERERIWNSFMADPEWLARRAETEKNGPLVASVVNAILEPTAFSALK